MRPDITTTMQAAVTAPTLSPILLCSLSFASGAVNAWSGTGNLTWNGITFTGVGAFGGINSAAETTDIRATSIDLSLSGIPSSLISLLLSDNYQGRPASIWFGLVDQHMNVIANPLLIFGGNMDTAKIEDNGITSAVTVTIENSLVDLSNPRVRRFTDQDQQNQYPGDLGLQYVGKIQNIDVNWGIANSPSWSLPQTNGGKQGGPGKLFP